VDNGFLRCGGLEFLGSDAADTEAAWRAEGQLLIPAERVPARDSQGRTVWVTRARPPVDRLACIWLIRRFIDPDAAIRYAERARDDEISFDMREVRFGHQGNHCSFETMLDSLLLDDPALRMVAEIVHEIDLRDDLLPAPVCRMDYLEALKQCAAAPHRQRRRDSDAEGEKGCKQCSGCGMSAGGFGHAVPP